MRTVGQILKEERLKKQITLEQVEKATKIRARFLTYLESDDYKNLPAVPYIQGFIKNYSDFLGLKSHTILALFRRQFTLKEKQQREQVEAPLTESHWQPTPNKIIFMIVVLMIGALLVYFYIQYNALHIPPRLTVENPKEDMVVKENIIAIYGTTHPDATLTINNDAILIREDGKFYKEITLTLGSNTFVIEATSRVGEKTQMTRQITRLESQ